MDRNEKTSKNHGETEDKFPGTTSAWSNAWCMDSQSSPVHENETRSEYWDYKDPKDKWDGAPK
jgi:hypothetical protein